MRSSSKNNAPSPAPDNSNRVAPLALSRGDPSGIGPEIALKAWLALRDAPVVSPFFFVADPAHIENLARRFSLPVPISVCVPAEARRIFPHALPVVALPGIPQGELGKPDVADAAVTLRSIEICAELVRAGEAAAMVTNPIAKDVLQRAGFAHPGHTEFLGELARRLFGDQRPRPVMLLWSDELAVVPATIHVPLADGRSGHR